MNLQAALIDTHSPDASAALDTAEEPGRRKRYFWTTTELATLRTLCLAGVTWVELLRQLPDREGGAIEQKAAEEGLPCPRPFTRRASTDELDAELTALLSGGPCASAIKALATKYNKPAWWLSRRAGQLGLTRPRLKEPEWSTPELGILDSYGDEGVVNVHRQLRLAGYSRTVGSVATKLGRREVERLSLPSMSARAVAERMGVDGKTVARWIDTRGLRATRTVGTWRITTKDLRRWLLDNPTAFDLRNVGQVWFMEVMRDAAV